MKIVHCHQYPWKKKLKKNARKKRAPKSSGILLTPQGAAYLKTTYHIAAVQNPRYRLHRLVPSSPLSTAAPTTATTTGSFESDRRSRGRTVRRGGRDWRWTQRARGGEEEWGTPMMPSCATATPPSRPAPRPRIVPPSSNSSWYDPIADWIGVFFLFWSLLR